MQPGSGSVSGLPLPPRVLWNSLPQAACAKARCQQLGPTQGQPIDGGQAAVSGVSAVHAAGVRRGQLSDQLGS